jgi:hypothetical protein
VCIYVLTQEITDFFLRTLTQSNAYEPPMSPPSSNVTYTVPVVQSSATTASDDHIQHNAAIINSTTTATADSATTDGTNSRVGDAAMLQQPITTAAAAYATDTFTEVPLKGRDGTKVQSVELEVARHLIVPPAVRYFVHQAEEWHACDQFATMPSQRCDVTVTLAPAGVLTLSTASTTASAAATQASSSNSDEQQHNVTNTTAQSHGDASGSGANGATASSFDSVQLAHDRQPTAGFDADQHTTAAADTVLDTATDAAADSNPSDSSAATAVSDVQLNGVQNVHVDSGGINGTVAAGKGYDELIVNVLKDRDGAGNSRWAAMTKASHSQLSLVI